MTKSRLVKGGEMCQRMQELRGTATRTHTRDGKRHSGVPGRAACPVSSNDVAAKFLSDFGSSDFRL